MKIKNQKNWDKWVENNKDPYGKAVVDYAERWSNMMEEAMSKGEKLEQCAERTSHEADTEGITGFMYGAAVQVLVTSWEYGEQLRRWHNLKTQIKDEDEKANESGGVLNPAILCIGEKE